jgi:hypothetical protein
MPIYMTSPEINFQQMLGHNIECLTNLVREEVSTIKNTRPLAIYDVQTDGIFSPKLAGWRYFILSGSKVISSADIAVENNGKSHRFLYFTKGAVLDKILDKISEIESLYTAKSDSFEIRILRVKALNLLAIWLHSSDNDFIYPIDNKLAQGAPYSLKWITEKTREELKLIESNGALTPKP